MAKGKSLAAKLATLKQLSAAVYSVLDKLSYVEAGFLLRSHLGDFVSGVYFLLDVLESLSPQQLAQLETEDIVNNIHKDLKPTLRRLCELSREVTFAGDPSRLPVEFQSSVEKLFCFVVDQFPMTDNRELLVEDAEARDYLNNIKVRKLQPIAVV